jgi:hypothetical protein
MQNLSYADLTLEATGLIYLNGHALRLCTFNGQHLLGIGDIDAIEFYDAKTIITGLHGSACEFELPLPPAVPMPVLDNFSEEEQRFLRSYLIGEDKTYIKTLVPLGEPELILARGQSLGMLIQIASMIKPIEADVRERAAAALRNRVLADKSADLTQDYIALSPSQEAQQAAVECNVVFALAPSVYDRLSRNAGGRSPSASRVKWLFNTMRIGDAVNIDAKLAKRAQTAVHVYAARTGRTFKTSSNRVTKILHVVRMEDRE